MEISARHQLSKSLKLSEHSRCHLPSRCTSTHQVLSFLVTLLLVVSGVLAVVILLAYFDLSAAPRKSQPASEVELQHEPIDLISVGVTTCRPHPQTRLVLLPELCQVHYPNGTITESLYYSTAYCSNCLCMTEGGRGSCSDDRCCCGAKELTNLIYTCPNYFKGESVVISDIPTSCTCQSCSQLRVSFIIQVLDFDKKPVSLANVTIDGQHSYQSDELGYVGFFVSAAQVKVDVSVQAFLCRDFKRHYFVIPGKVNKLVIQLQAMQSITIIPPRAPFIIRFSTLDIVPLRRSISFSSFTLDDLIDLMDLMDTFDLHYGEVFAYFPSKVFPGNKLFTFISPTPQSLYDTATPESLDISFLARRWNRLNRIFTNTPLLAIGWGQLEIYDEDGRPFDPLLPAHNEHYSILVGLSPYLRLPRTKLEEAHLFAHNDSGDSFRLVMQTSYIYQSYFSKIQWAVFPIYSTLPKFPLRLAIAYEEENVCYIAVRVHDPFKLIHDSSTRGATLVRVFTQIGTNASSIEDQPIFLNSGIVNSCIAIPCQGELTLQVLDNSEIQTSYAMSIGDNFEEYESGSVGPTYTNLRTCEAFGLESELGSPDHVMLDLVPNYCPKTENFEQVKKSSFTTQMSSTKAFHQEAVEFHEYCSIKVLVRMCSQTITTVTFVTEENVLIRSISSDADKRGRKQQAEEFEEEAFYDDMEYQSGDYVEYADCNRASRICFSFMCDSRVNLTVMNSVASNPDSPNDLNFYNDEFLQTNTNNSEAIQYSTIPCLPHSNSNSPDLNYPTANIDSSFLSNDAQQDSSEFVFEGMRGGERGVYRSATTREVAQQKCTSSDLDDIGVYFDCVARE